MDLTSVVPNYVPEIWTDIVLYLRRDSYSVQGCCPFCKIIQTCHGLIYPCWSLARKLTSAKTCRLATFPPSILLLESSSCRYRVNNLLCSMDIATIFIKKLSSYGTTVGLMKFVAALYIVLMVSSTNSEHRSTVCSLYFFLLTKINKNENVQKNMILVKKLVFCSQMIDSQKRSDSLICSFIMSDLSKLLTIALLSWATWAIWSTLLICPEQSEKITHSHSFVLSDLSKFERMSEFPTLMIRSLAEPQKKEVNPKTPIPGMAFLAGSMWSRLLLVHVAQESVSDLWLWSDKHHTVVQTILEHF